MDGEDDKIERNRRFFELKREKWGELSREKVENTILYVFQESRPAIVKMKK